MAAASRSLLRLTILVRPALLVLMIALYLSPLVKFGWRTSRTRAEESLAARAQLQVEIDRAGAAAHTPAAYFQAALFAPLKWFGSDLCYRELTQAQLRLISHLAAPSADHHELAERRTTSKAMNRGLR